jgi:hypothetical protein
VDCCIHYGTFAAYVHSTLATRHPEASHATIVHLDSVSAKLRDLLRRIIGFITNCLNDWVAQESSGADPSPSHLEHGNGEGMACSAQGGAFKRTVARKRDTVNQGALWLKWLCKLS